MLEEFERALARGQSLQQTRERLIMQTEEHRRQMLAQIESDFKEAQVIEYGLTLPRHSPAYGTARGAVSWFRKKYPPLDDGFARELLKTVWMSTNGRKGANSDDKGTGGEGESRSTVDGGSAPGEAALHEPVPEIEP